MANAELEDQARVLEEWLRLPASRRRHATDAVAFAYRLIQEHPELSYGGTDQQHIVKWLLPHVAIDRY